MTISYLAEASEVAYVTGRLVLAFGLPLLGLILLIVGLQKRSAARKQTAMGYPPGYPPPGPPTPGYPQAAPPTPGYPPQGPATPGYPPASPAHGQPGYPGYPPGGGYPMPAPQPPKPSGTGFITTGAVLLVIGGLGMLGTFAAIAAKESGRVSVGDCVTNEVLTDDWRPKNCSDPEAVLQYAAKADSNGNCPDGERSDSSYLSMEHRGTRICFVPNLIQGQCYVSIHDNKSMEPASCASARAIRIVKRIDGSTDTSDCPAGTRFATYDVPKRIYCTEAAGQI